MKQKTKPIMRQSLISLFIRFVIIVAIVVSITDILIFHQIQKYGIQSITWQFTALVIIVTIVPIVINFWYWLVFKPRAKGIRQSVILWLCVGFALMVCWLLALMGIL